MTKSFVITEPYLGNLNCPSSEPLEEEIINNFGGNSIFLNIEQFYLLFQMYSIRVHSHQTLVCDDY